MITYTVDQHHNRIYKEIDLNRFSNILILVAICGVRILSPTSVTNMAVALAQRHGKCDTIFSFCGTLITKIVEKSFVGNFYY